MAKGRTTYSGYAELDSEIERIPSARYVRISLASRMTGLTVKAINNKIDSGVWLEGREWRRGPDGNRYIDIEGYNAWVRGEHNVM